MNFKEFVQSELEEQTTSSSSTSKEESEAIWDLMDAEDAKLTDEEGQKIAKAVNADYKGHTLGVYWFNDRKTGSSYLGRDLEDTFKKRQACWDRHDNPPK